MTNTFQSLSKGLYNILDLIGASEEVRAEHWRSAMNFEILSTASRRGISSIYQFGSMCEGTTLPDMCPDLDLLSCSEEFFVLEDIKSVPKDGISYLMLNDNDTKPGYFNLQTVFNGVPQTIFQREIETDTEYSDKCGRILRKHIKIGSLVDKAFTERNGPAHSSRDKDGIWDTDFVLALRCKTVPSNLNSRLRKCHSCHWPPEKLRSELNTYGCFFVGVGHPNSQNKAVEWRISFSLQERRLMSSLNPTQHKCFILLKMIKKDIIKPRAGEKSISSYHCKTCLFHVLENSRPELWTRRNLIQGVRVCLAVLLSWVRRGNCPNYFIPEENMFDRLNKDTLDKTAEVLTDVLHSGARFLLNLQCEHIGDLVYRYVRGERLAQIRNFVPRNMKEELFVHNLQTLYYCRNKVLQPVKIHCEPNKYLSSLMHVLQTLEYNGMVRDHRTEDIQQAIHALVPQIQQQILQSIASSMPTHIGTNVSGGVGRLSQHVLPRINDCDLISSKLVLASCFLRADILQKCEATLLTCENLLDDSVVSVCGCYAHKQYGKKTRFQLPINRNTCQSNTDFRCKAITGCMLFLPAQANLVHPALRLEMYRSVFTPPGSRKAIVNYWFDWILVDSKVYLYFLQYLLYSKTRDKKTMVIDNLAQLVCTDQNLGHRETAFNLLGWIYSQENRIQEAFRCFLESWRIRPVHNAAKWHILVLLCKLYRR